MKTKKWLKVLVIVAAVVLLILVALSVLAKLLITPELVKKTVLPKVKEALHREVELGDVEVSIFSGIALKDLVIREKEGPEPFVKADRLVLRYRFWPLLLMRVVVDEVRLDAPRIRVVQLSKGTFNFSDLTAKKAGEAPQPAPKPAAEEGKKAPLNLQISRVALTDGEVTYEDRSVTPAHPFSYKVTGIQVSAREISLEKPFPFTAKAKLPGAAVECDGTAANVAAKPALDATIKVIDADLRQLTAALPAEVKEKLAALAPSGVINVRLHLAGDVASPQELLKDGEVRLSNVQASAGGQRPALTGTLALTKDAVSSQNLTLAMGSNQLKVDFKASNLLGKPLLVTSQVKGEQLDLNPFLKKGGGATGGTAAGPAPKAKPTGPEPGPLNLPVKVTGSVQIGKVLYQGLTIEEFALRYRLADNVLTVESLSGKVAGGTFSNSARVDLGQKGFAYGAKLKVTGVQAEPVVAAFAPKAAGTVFGALSLNADLNGRGTIPEALKKNLSGQGDFAINDGRLTGAGLIEGLARYLKSEQLRVLRFSKFAGTFRVQNGNILLDSDIAGKDVRVKPKGTVGLDQLLDLSIETRLSPELTQKVAGGEIGRYMSDDQGWGLVPLKVTGSASSPKFALNTALLKEQAKAKAKEKLQQKLGEKLFKKKDGEQRPEQQLLEKGLKGLFGK